MAAAVVLELNWPSFGSCKGLSPVLLPEMLRRGLGVVLRVGGLELLLFVGKVIWNLFLENVFAGKVLVSAVDDCRKPSITSIDPLLTFCGCLDALQAAGCCMLHASAVCADLLLIMSLPGCVLAVNRLSVSPVGLKAL